jgi:hypothetical protein
VADVASRSQLHAVREGAVHAKARAVGLERTAASLKRELEKAGFKRNELEGLLDKANPEIEQLSEIVDAAETSHKDWQAGLESMDSER